jgi:hypothetical protein
VLARISSKQSKPFKKKVEEETAGGFTVSSVAIWKSSRRDVSVDTSQLDVLSLESQSNYVVPRKVEWIPNRYSQNSIVKSLI